MSRMIKVSGQKKCAVCGEPATHCLIDVDDNKGIMYCPDHATVKAQEPGVVLE